MLSNKTIIDFSSSEEQAQLVLTDEEISTSESQVLDDSVPLPTPTPSPPSYGSGTFDAKENIDRLTKFIFAVMVVVVVAFFLMIFNFFIDKSVIINYNNFANKYFKEYLELNNSFNEIEKQNIAYNSRILMLEEKNMETTAITDCLENKKYRYWEYEKCFN